VRRVVSVAAREVRRRSSEREPTRIRRHVERERGAVGHRAPGASVTFPSLHDAVAQEDVEARTARIPFTSMMLVSDQESNGRRSRSRFAGRRRCSGASGLS